MSSIQISNGFFIHKGEFGSAAISVDDILTVSTCKNMVFLQLRHKVFLRSDSKNEYAIDANRLEQINGAKGVYSAHDVLELVIRERKA